MAMIVVLVKQQADAFSVREEAVLQLARLGVTNLALLRDEQTAGVVLEGWLFDPLGSARAVTNAIGGEHATRLLHPVMQLAISTNTKEAQIAHQHS